MKKIFHLFKNLPKHSLYEIFEFIKRRANQLRPKLGFGAFYCKALSGESNYNICINSDMSVSCNCMDYDGSGQIGSLRTNNLQEIFDGEIAQSFRHQLLQGKLPIKTCHGCNELTLTGRKNAREKSQNYTVPKLGIMIENTVICCLECIACDRSVVSKRKSKSGGPGGTTMSLEDVRIAAKTVSDYQIQSICFHNLGEPFLSRRILDEMKIIREFNPDTQIIVSTNGLLIDDEQKRQAALLFDHIYISLDGSTQKSVESYQVGSNFKKSYENMRRLVEFRDSHSLSSPIIEWKYVVFEWNDSREEIDQAVELAKDAKIDCISFWKGYLPNGQGMSVRFNKDSFFANLGDPSWKGREIVFRK